MMKLNGKVYLSYDEVTVIAATQLDKFSTSQHATMPRVISYVDSELIRKIRDRANDVTVAFGFLYKTENFVEFNEIVNTISSFFYEEGDCESSLSFLTAQLTEPQVAIHRAKYFHYMFNVMSGEIIKTLISKFM